MRLIKEKDLYEIRLLSQISNEDFRVLHLLYQPFLGNLAVSIYQSFIYTAPLFENGPSSHDFLFKQLETNSLAFANALARLEACELIRTYVEKSNDFSYFYYEVYAPKLAQAFFKDPVFSGLLTSNVGERRVQQLAQLFAHDRPYDMKDKEVTTTFGQVFTPDFNSSAFNTKIDVKQVGRNENKRKTPFNIELFKSILKENFMIIADLALSKEDLKKINNLTMVFGFNEETIAGQIASAYDASKTLGQRIDFDYVSQMLRQMSRYEHIARPKRIQPLNVLNSDAEMAQLINRMEIEACADFLSSFSKASTLASSEINLLLRLSNDFGLSNAAINALVYHVLTTKDMKLPSSYVEKLAANIARLGLVHAVDVINYFDEQKPISRTKKTITQTQETNDDSEISDEAYKKLLEEMNRV